MSAEPNERDREMAADAAQAADDATHGTLDCLAWHKRVRIAIAPFIAQARAEGFAAGADNDIHANTALLEAENARLRGALLVAQQFFGGIPNAHTYSTDIAVAARAVRDALEEKP